MPNSQPRLEIGVSGPLPAPVAEHEEFASSIGLSIYENIAAIV
jgi:hypothetical protein